MTRLFSAAAIFLGTAFCAGASYFDNIGYTELRTLLGSATPTGAGVSMIQVEAGTDYVPDTSLIQEFSGKTITVKSGSSGPSGHASTVAIHFYGLLSSVAPGVTLIDCYAAGHWLSAGMLNHGVTNVLGRPLEPATTSRDVENHSWIGTFGSETEDQDVLRRFDYTIQRDDYVAVAGLNNGGTVPNLLAASYNAISVGRSDGGHGSGTTAVDGMGRVKPEIVSPIGVTSFSTPTVGAAAAMLIQKARSDAQLANGAKSQTVKAILLAGATKSEFPNWNRTTMRPLDSQFGAGELNVLNSYKILVAGEQPPGSVALVPPRGWDFNTTISPGSRLYFFEVPAGYQLPTLSAVVTWHRVISDGYGGSGWGNPTSTLGNLSLRLYQANEFTPGAILDESLSPVDNVEHIFQKYLPAGRYALEVTSNTGNVAFALAWTSEPAPLPSITVSVNDDAGSEFGADTASFLVTRTGGDMSQALTVPYTISGGAIPGSDYAALSGSVIIPAGEGSASVLVIPNRDTEIEGDESVTVTLSPNAAYTVGNPATGSVAIHDLPFDTWRKSVFSAAEIANPEIAGDLANPDGDGLLNLAEYAFGGDPKASDAAAQPAVFISQDGFLTLTYKRPAAALDLDYIAQLSTDLVTWESGAAFLEETRVPDPINPLLENVAVRVRVAVQDAERQFLRVLIQRK